MANSLASSAAGRGDVNDCNCNVAHICHIILDNTSLIEEKLRGLFVCFIAGPGLGTLLKKKYSFNLALFRRLIFFFKLAGHFLCHIFPEI